MNQSIVFLCLTSVIGLSLATDYCSSALQCSGGRTNIACGHSGNFASSCPRNAAMVHIDDSLKSLIVNGHNEKRNLIAGGGVANHRPACRMATMQWDNDLAYTAAFNVRQCAMVHDKCRITESFQYAGQNLAWRSFNGSPDYVHLFQKSIDSWYDEVQYSNMNYIESYPQGYSGPAIGHFTVMMADRNIRVGCAASTYNNRFLVACNYATTNMVNFPIYTSCSSAASTCTTGRNPQYPNLCSASEFYDVNKWF